MGQHSHRGGMPASLSLEELELGVRFSKDLTNQDSMDSYH